MGLFNNVFTTCDHCNSWTFVKYKEHNGDGLCNECYLERELYECETCGREITKFDYDDYSGECPHCHDEYTES